MSGHASAIPRPTARAAAPAPYVSFRHVRPWLFCLGGVLIASIYLFPVYWMVISALKGGNELNASVPTLYPHAPTLNAFRWIFQRENVERYLENSAIISVSVTALKYCPALSCNSRAILRRSSSWTRTMFWLNCRKAFSAS